MLDLLAYRLEDRGVTDARLEPGAVAPLSPIDRFGPNPLTEEEAEALSEIIAAFKGRHGTTFTEEDLVRFEAVRADMVADEDMAAMLRNNAPKVSRPRFDAEFMRRPVQAFHRDRAMQGAFLQDREAREMLMRLMFGRVVRAANHLA